MLVAEGAVDVAPSPSWRCGTWRRWTRSCARPAGTFTALDGQSGPWHGNALATNGLLHEAAMAYLGYFPDTDPLEPEDMRAPSAENGRTNVTDLAAHRRSDG